MVEKAHPYSAGIVHTCPLSVRGGGEMNVNWMLKATADDVRWRAFGIDCPDDLKNTFIPHDIPYVDLGHRSHDVPSVHDAVTVRRELERGTPVLFTANDIRTLGLMTILRAAMSDNQYYLWQSVPKRPDIDDPKKRMAIEAKNFLAAHIAPHHLTFSPECVSQLGRIGVADKRINLIPQPLNQMCDRGLRSESLGGRDKESDALRILVISRVTRTKGIHKLPALLQALDAQIGQQGVKMSVTLMGNNSHSVQGNEILTSLNEVSQGLRNVRFEYTGYQPAEVVYERMAHSDIALSLAGTEGYSVSFIEGLNMGLPHAVQPICAPNVDVISRSGAGWILTGDARQDAEMLSQLRFDDNEVADRRKKGYVFVDRTTGHDRFRNEFIAAVFRK